MNLNKLSKISALLLSASVFCACEYIPTFDDVIPDKRSEYQKSRSLPDLEVPPDLTIEDDDNLVIPGEAEPTTLTAFELQKKRGGLSELELLAEQYPGEKVLPIPGSSVDAWPQLIGYWRGKGYQIDLQDAELGVLETTWLENKRDNSTYRDKFKIFAEPTETGNNTILFISSERQEKIGLGDTNTEWLDQEPDDRKTDRYVAEIKTLFYGSSDVIAVTDKGSSAKPIVQRAPAVLENSGDSKYLLRLPEEYKQAWPQTEELLGRVGAFVEKKDVTKGVYYVIYQEPIAEEKEEKGFFSRLKFWGDDEPDSLSFQLSVTGVEANTEIVVLDDDGDWDDSDEAYSLLSSMKNEYNRL